MGFQKLGFSRNLEFMGFHGLFMGFVRFIYGFSPCALCSAIFDLIF